MEGGEGNPKLDWDHGHAPLLPSVLGIKLHHLCLEVLVTRQQLTLAPALLDGAVDQLLVVVGHHVLLVEVAAPNLLGLKVQLPGDLFDPVLDYHHPLRSSEAPEGRVGGQVGPAHVALHPQVWDLVAVVRVEHRPLHHGEAQVHGPARVVEQVHVGRLDLALLGEGHLVAAEEGVAPAADGHVLVPVQHQPHGPPSLGRGKGHHRAQRNGP